MPTITQAQLDAMIASGEVSLTPPVTPSFEKKEKKGIFPLTPETPTSSRDVMPMGGMGVLPQETKAEERLNDVPIKERSYILPSPRPSRIPLESKRYLAELKRITKISDKIDDPELAARAIDVLGSGADYRDIDKAVRVFAYKDRVAKANAKRKALAEAAARKRANSFSIDKKKTKEKYAQSAAAYRNMGTLLSRLVDNYQDDYVGWFDAPYNDAATVAPIPQEKGAGTYKQDYDAIFLLSKDANNMGANFTKSEQAMLRATMPALNEKEDVYKRKTANYIRTMRDIVASKLKASQDAGYKIGALENVAKELDGAYNNALHKFGLKEEEVFREETRASDDSKKREIVSLRPSLEHEPSPSMTREEKIKFLMEE